jgi:hypothetical protein
VSDRAFFCRQCFLDDKNIMTENTRPAGFYFFPEKCIDYTVGRSRGLYPPTLRHPHFQDYPVLPAQKSVLFSGNTEASQAPPPPTGAGLAQRGVPFF